MQPTESSRIRKMNHADLENVLAWRNHPEVRRYMYTQHEITMYEHVRWFERASTDPERHLLIFERDATPTGFINFQVIASGGIANWGFYAAPDAPKGTGRLLGQAALEYAFTDAKLHKICGQALAFNERSIRFHQSLGFSKEGNLRHQHYDGQNYHDVVCFGLLASEWQSNN